MTKGIFGRALGTVVNPVVECVDVDGIVREIDVNAVLERVDINGLLDRVDVNRQLDRVDVDHLLERIDVNELIQKSDLAAILAQSSSGVFSAILDGLRTQIVVIDLGILRICRCGSKFDGDVLPPAPGKVDQHTPYPDSSMGKAVAIQGHYCGIFSKAVAVFIDLFIISINFALFILVIEILWRIFVPTDGNQIIDRDKLWVQILFGIYWFCYFSFGVALSAGQTIGMAIVGIKVVELNGSPVKLWRAMLRALMLPISLILCPILGLLGAIRRDGRMLHDLVACTGIIFKWNAKVARLRERSVLQSTLPQYGSDDEC